MGKVSSFRAEQVKLTCDEPTVRNLSERWVVQFVGAPGLNFATMSESKNLTNVHYVCPYRKFDWDGASTHGKLVCLLKSLILNVV